MSLRRGKPFISKRCVGSQRDASRPWPATCARLCALPLSGASSRRRRSMTAAPCSRLPRVEIEQDKLSQPRSGGSGSPPRPLAWLGRREWSRDRSRPNAPELWIVRRRAVLLCNSTHRRSFAHSRSTLPQKVGKQHFKSGSG
jgi:hypothetical protein